MFFFLRVDQYFWRSWHLKNYFKRWAHVISYLHVDQTVTSKLCKYNTFYSDLNILIGSLIRYSPSTYGPVRHQSQAHPADWAVVSCALYCAQMCVFVRLQALSVGIFPYVLKLLQSSARELRPLLVFIWAKILAVDSVSYVNLIYNRHMLYIDVILYVLSMPSFFFIQCFLALSND